MPSLIIGVICFGWAVFALALWASIEVVDRHNSRNTFGAALGWSALHLAVDLAASQAALLGLVLLVGWCVFLGKLLVTRYELGLGRALGVIALTSLALPYVIREVLTAVVLRTHSLLALELVLVGTPIAIVGGWWFARRRAAPVASPALPVARVEKHVRKPAIPPVAGVAPPVAPPHTGGEPSLLR